MTKKPEGEILRGQLSEGLAALRRSAVGLFVSSTSGGLDVGFSLFLSAAVLTLVGGQGEELVERLLIANAYAVGFVLVILGRSELFTEQTALAILPVLNRNASLRSLGRLWAVVYAGNIVGAVTFAAIAAVVGPALGVIDPGALDALAGYVVGHPWWVILLSASLAGWLMGLLSWLVTAARDTIGQIVVVWIIAASIGFALLHHAVVGTVEVMAAVFAGDTIGLADFAYFLVFATLGNTVGGVVFVGALKYTHAVRGGRLTDVDLAPPKQGA